MSTEARFQIPVSPSLRLAAFEPAHAEELFALVDANRAYLRRWLPWLDRTRAVTETTGFIDFARSEREKKTGLHLGIFEEGRLVGVCGYNHLNHANRLGHIGYWLSAAEQGRGVMSRSVAALTSYGFAKLDLHRQVITCAEGNGPSAAVAERCGYRFEGVARECEWLYDRFVSHRVYARLRTDAV